MLGEKVENSRRDVPSVIHRQRRKMVPHGVSAAKTLRLNGFGAQRARRMLATQIDSGDTEWPLNPARRVWPS
jgi:hypothetical protein